MFRVSVTLFSKLFICMILLICAFPGSSLSGEVSLGTFLDQVEARAGNVSSFKCDFKQERHLSIFPKPVVFSGQLLLKRPDKLRWEFISPIPSALILKGSSGIKCEPRGKMMPFSLDSDPIMRFVAKQLWSWTGGTYRDLADDFNMELSPGPTLTLSPAKEGAENFLQKITVRFDPDSLQPVRVTIEQPGDDRTILFFKNYQINLQFPDTSFTECRALQ